MIKKRNNRFHMDTVIDGVRYREALGTTDRREAISKEKDRIAEIKAGKVVGPDARAYARWPFAAAAAIYQSQRQGKVAERTTQFEAERLKPLVAHFRNKILRTIKPGEIAGYQQVRITQVSGRTVNMETGVLHRILRKAKLFAVVEDFPQRFPEHHEEIGKALETEKKVHLFRVAADPAHPGWMVAHCAAVIAANTTARQKELKSLRWKDVDLFGGIMLVTRSKTAAGRREIPLNSDALTAFARLRERAEALTGPVDPDHFVFPACEHHVDPTKPQKSWRTAWPHLVREAARRAGRRAAAAPLAATRRLRDAKQAWRQAAAPYVGFRFHDLRHQAITEMAEAGAPDSVIQSLAGHMSKRMQEHYSHVRKAAKRQVTDRLAGGLMNPPPPSKPGSEKTSGLSN